MIQMLGIAENMEDLINTLFTLIIGAILYATAMAGLSDVSAIFAIAASCVALVFWIPTIRRKIRNEYGGSLIRYIKEGFGNWF